MQIIIGILIALHGVAHIPGFAVSWRLADLQGMPYHTSVFGGRLQVGDGGMRALGILWLVAALAFVAVGIAALFNRSWWVTAGLAVAVLSLALCATEIRAARVGVVVNVVLLGLLLGLRGVLQHSALP